MERYHYLGYKKPIGYLRLSSAYRREKADRLVAGPERGSLRSARRQGLCSPSLRSSSRDKKVLDRGSAAALGQ